MATMSGRGVITSRTIVSRNSTRDRSSSRAWPSCNSCCCSSRSRDVGSGSWVAPSRAVSEASTGCPAGPARRTTRSRRRAAVNGLRRRAMASKAGSRISRTRSGSRRTMSSGTRCSHTRTNMRLASTRMGSPRAKSRPVTRASSVTAAMVMPASSRRAGMNRRSGSSRYHPRVSSRPPRSAINRSDNRISALKAVVTVPMYTANRPSKNSRSGVIGAAGRSGCP